MTNQFFAKYELTTELNKTTGKYYHSLVIEVIDEDFSPMTLSGIAIPQRKNTLNLDLAGIAEAQAQADKIRKDLTS